MAEVCSDLIVQREAPGQWVLYNVAARTSLGVDAAVLAVLSDWNGSDLAALAARHGDHSFRIWDVQAFTNADGLLADPTRRLRPASAWPQGQTVTFDALVAALKQHCLLIDDEAAYRARFGPKRHILDGEHFGNFHQQLGQELLMVRRQPPEPWWVAQKFTDDGQDLRNNLYGAVQGYNLNRYLDRRITPGMQVIDLGCGTGFWTNRMARRGAEVLGLDPNPAYLATARETAVAGARYETAAIGTPDGLAAIPDASADLVFMSDALLFYFVPERPDQPADLGALLADIRRILKPGGVYVSVEPHAVFWLQPWLGTPEHPFTVISEYRHRQYAVTATPGDLLQAWCRHGFGVTWMEEWWPDPAFAATDPRAFGFANEFPLWHLYELTPQTVR